jgi:SpoVK/Ycf46/Vps4 family AAA+-type ATPase
LSGAEIVAACRDAALMALEEEELQGSEDGRPTISMHNMTEALVSMERQINKQMLDFYASF